MELNDLIGLTSDYKENLLEERGAIALLTEARAALETERARLLSEAYELGKIDGKNDAQRKLQEAAILEDANSLYWLAFYERRAAHDVDFAEIERKSAEVEISLIKAWLYSQARTA